MTNWTSEDIPNLDGKTIIVTGANSGLGYESTLALAEKGALVVMACRNLEKGRKALENIKTVVPSAQLDLMELDLADLKSIHAFAAAFKGKYDRLDVLLNNAGVMLTPRRLTADGFESQFGINHLGHFALTGLLLDLLLKTPESRVVAVSSQMHVDGKMVWDDLMGEQSYNNQDAYRQSKLANLLFAFELNRKLQATGSTTMAVGAHPGMADTNWVANNLSGLMKFFMGLMAPLMSQKADLGALSQLFAATSADVKTGGYYGPDGVRKGYPVEVRAAEAAYDEADAQKLWALSEELTGVKYSF